VLSGMSRARELLRARLTRRGLALSAGLLTGALGHHAAATAVQAGLAETAVKTGLRYAAGRPVAASVARLADGFLKTLNRARLAITVGLVSVLTVVVAVVSLPWYRSWTGGAGNPSAPVAGVAVTPETERAKLQGSWKVTSFTMGGRPLPDKDIQGIRFTFTDSQWAMSAPGVQPPLKPVAVDPSQEPKAIDFTMPAGTTVLGIYHLDGDSLMLCVDHNPAGTAGKRPTAFRSPPDAPSVGLFVLRREPAGLGSP
jgi:uncharacterized protein (TIGR03067 family)